MEKELKPTKPDNHYVDNILLYEQVVKWKSTYDTKPKMPDTIALAIMAIAEGLIKRYNFSGYSDNWKQDMLSDGIEDCVKGLHHFDPERSKNVYGYINQTCWYAFVRRIKTEKKETASMYKFFMTNVYDEVSDEIEADETFIQDIHSKITEYEESIKVKPKKKEEHTLEDFLGI